MWIAAYRYNDRTFRVIVNARTGALHGERPWSFMKITGSVLEILAAVGAVVILFVVMNR